MLDKVLINIQKFRCELGGPPLPRPRDIEACSLNFYVARCEVSALAGKRLHSAQLAALDVNRILVRAPKYVHGISGEELTAGRTGRKVVSGVLMGALIRCETTWSTVHLKDR